RRVRALSAGATTRGTARRVGLALTGTVLVAVVLLGAKGFQRSAATRPPAGRPGGGATGVPLPTGRYTVTGDWVDTPFGPVQVRITIDGSRLVDITELRSPDTYGLSIQINAYAAPALRQEALAAQGPRIDAVTGATYTSQAYTQSLQSALTRA